MNASPPLGSSVARWQPKCWRWLLPASAWLLAGACGPGVATPMPEPPTAFDVTKVGPPSGIQPATEGDAEKLAGLPGSVPGGALVRVTNLELMNPTVGDSARPDGSFEISVFVADGDELRFEWLVADERSAPADARFVTSASGFQLEPSARFECLRLEPGFVVDFGAEETAELVVENTCEEPVTLDNPRTRLALLDFTLETALPLELGPGETTALQLGFARGANTAREDTLFFDATLGATTIRYPITLSAPAIP